jgi:formiminotetrahydrofolate cyclodeaminase
MSGKRIENEPVDLFLKQLASAEPIPGGGSVAALCGALGAALVAMVCNLTINKKKYELYQEDITRLLGQAESYRARFTDLINQDMDVFAKFAVAYKIPAEDPRRGQQIQNAAREATDVPLQVAEAALEILKLCEPLVQKGNKNVLSDVGAAVVMADAAVRSAALNIYINTKTVNDEAFNREKTARIGELVETSNRLAATIYAAVKNNL